MALEEVIRMAKDANVSTQTWDVIFRTLFDLPQKLPPPTNLSFSQELDVRHTNAVGPGLVEVAGRLTGLRCLKMSSKEGTKASASDVLSSLVMANAPLEIFQFDGQDPGIVEALFRHHQNLKEIKMIGFIGDGRPLLCDWPEPVPNLTLNIGKDCVPKSSSWSYDSGCGKSPGTIFSERPPALPYWEQSVWPDNIIGQWMEDSRMQQIKAVAESDLFDVSNVSSKSHALLTEWSVANQVQPSANIEVVLVTQCSVDRLPNLQAQFAFWTGKASVAIYLKPTENKTNAIDGILSTIKKARANVGNNFFDVAEETRGRMYGGRSISHQLSSQCCSTGSTKAAFAIPR
jgi:hypothetical protein